MAIDYTKEIVRSLDKLTAEVHQINRYLRSIQDTTHEVPIEISVDDIRNFFKGGKDEDTSR